MYVYLLVYQLCQKAAQPYAGLGMPGFRSALSSKRAACTRVAGAGLLFGPGQMYWSEARQAAYLRFTWSGWTNRVFRTTSTSLGPIPGQSSRYVSGLFGTNEISNLSRILFALPGPKPFPHKMDSPTACRSPGAGLGRKAVRSPPCRIFLTLRSIRLHGLTLSRHT